MNAAQLLAQAIEPATAAAERGLQPGGKFGEYLLIDEIGRGGMGMVFTAMSIGSNRVVALKVPHRAHGDNEALKRRFRTEAEAVATLDHRGILPIYESGSVGGIPFFTMK